MSHLSNKFPKPKRLDVKTFQPIGLNNSPAGSLHGRSHFQRTFGHRFEADVGKRKGTIEIRLLHHFFHFSKPGVLDFAAIGLITDFGESDIKRLLLCHDV